MGEIKHFWDSQKEKEPRKPRIKGILSQKTQTESVGFELFRCSEKHWFYKEEVVPTFLVPRLVPHSMFNQVPTTFLLSVILINRNKEDGY